MIADLLLQAISIIIVIFMFLYMYKIPQKYIAKYRSRSSSNTSTLQARRHFIAGAQHLSKSRSTRDISAAKLAVEEAEKAISLDPSDAASHILKALGLEMLGFKTAAIESIDVALSPLAVKSLADDERGDALYKRAELRLGVSGEERVEEVVSDLVESVKLKKENVKAFVMLGECYERKEMKEKAVEAYENAIRVDSDHKVAKEALNRLGSS
ncbi:Kinase superfamily protein [Heracleum sosnowskyi]|uniref:Kinase superfamily protein n=1 Tax=Heracleum sosnowskyi TaxID=360622 RepID=A0AAD8HGX3_9APIA|nr:Kinase superfamily protein [Heracleum sosnowskyi]